MDAARFEHLLLEEEGSSLDFKRDQYPFAKATDDEKSELLKDILGLVNAWRRSEAYILIGVEDVRGGRSQVVGVSEHLADHSLQQFVNNLTNRPVQFGYEAFSIEGKQVGIIRIEQQPRPVYLKYDYGKLEKGKVYVRRGSSTDPTKPADPDEIARMGQPSVVEQAELSVLFAELDREQAVGDAITLQAEYCEMPTQIPLLNEHWRPSLNQNFLREMAKFTFVCRLHRPVRLVVQNTGSVAANDVRLELTATKDQQIKVLSRAQLPDRPHRSFLVPLPGIAGVIRGQLPHPGKTSVSENRDAFRVEIDCGLLQPGRKVWSEKFYLGRHDSGAIRLDGSVFAANLANPKSFTLTVSVEVAQSRMTLIELTAQPVSG